MSENKTDQYWASVPASEIADQILDKEDKYFKYLAEIGRLDLYRRSWTYYYRPGITGAMLNPVGQQGELTAMSVNDFRNLLMHLETMTLSQRVNFEPRAVNSDVKSQSQVVLASGLLDYYMRVKRLERYLKQAVKEGLLIADAFVRAEWNPKGGNTYGKTGTGALVYEGDIKYSNYNALSCVRDFTRPYYSPEEDYVILRDPVNKFDLAGQFPDLKEKILEDSMDPLEVQQTSILKVFNVQDTDQIMLRTLLHPPTPALPQGRFTTCLGNGTVLQDGPIPYEKTHVYRIAPDELTGTIFGYTVAFDLLPVQEASDLLYSTVITNQSTFGVQNILMPKGHDIKATTLAGGLNVVEYDPKVGKPEPLQLTSTPAELFTFIEELQRVKQMLAGVDSVTRGDPEANLKSGTALALVAAQSIQFSMSLQQSYAQLVEDLGTATIELLQTFAAVPRVAEIVGKANRPLMKEFAGKDLDAIHRVSVDMGNPMTRTTAGKVNLAEMFLQNDMIENPDQFIQVVTTGRLEPVIEGKQANLLLIKGENEKLAEGQQQRALITDYHAKHILEHSTVLANPEIRMDPNNPIVQLTLDHIQEHIMMASSPGYLSMAQLLGHEIVAPIMPPMPGAPQNGASQMLNGAPPAVQEAEGARPPQGPAIPEGTNPQTAEIIQAGV